MSLTPTRDIEEDANATANASDVSPLDPAAAAPAQPRIAGRYEILGLIGMGGMGSVYRVRDTELDEVVALKFLRHDAGGDRTDVAQNRFRDEAKLARRVSHVNVARTFDIGDHDGEKFITMEYVDGEPLSRLLEREGSLSLRRVADIACQLCAGLAAAHAAGVVHRDLKPDNVLIERVSGGALVGGGGAGGGGEQQPRIVISDFGIARTDGPRISETRSGGIVGTAEYMAPEQAEGGAVDARTDVYALGALVFEMLTGRRAWTGESFVQVAARRLLEPPPDPRALRPELPAPVADVVMRCMARRPDDRFQHASAVAAALEEAVAQATATAEASAPTSPLDAMAIMPLPARAFRVAPAPHEHGTMVAVIPFKNQGPPEDDFLADELTDELIDALSMTGGLRLRPRRLVERHDTGDLQAFGRALDVHVVIEGTLRRTTDTVRITARAIAIAEGLQVWARRFELPSRELARANHEVATAVGDALTSRGRGSKSERPYEERKSADPIAAELYLRARRELRRGWAGTGDIDLAVELFRQCLARTPDDWAALSGYAMARARRYNYRGGDDAELAGIRSRAEQAMALAPHSGEPWQTFATLSFVTSEWPDAVRSLRRALHLAPGLLKAHETLAHIEAEVGRIDEGLFRLETLISLDPTASLARWEAARVHGMCGRWDRAYELLDLPVEAGADSIMQRVGTARLELWRGVPRLPLVTEEEALGDESLALARGFGRVVRERKVPIDIDRRFRDRIARTSPRSRLRPLLWQLRAEIHAGAGEQEHALEAVRGAVGAELYDLAWLERCPLFEPLRSDPSWLDLVATVKARTRPVIAALDEAIA